MKTPSFNPGDLVRIGNPSDADADGDTLAPFTDITGTVVDPTTVTLTVLAPDASTLIYAWPDPGTDGTLLRESLGRFYFDVELDQSGSWSWQLSSTGTVETSEEGILYVLRSVF